MIGNASIYSCAHKTARIVHSNTFHTNLHVYTPHSWLLGPTVTRASVSGQVQAAVLARGGKLLACQNDRYLRDEGAGVMMERHCEGLMVLLRTACMQAYVRQC